MDRLKSEYKVIGVMSGTSLDGIDLVYVTFFKEETWQFKIHFAETIAYPQIWKVQLQKGIHLYDGDLQKLNMEYTQYLGGVISNFIKSIHEISSAESSISRPCLPTGRFAGIDAVCSHGHTIFHKPEEGITLQIGNLPQIADLVGERVVCDFRKQDVLLGGQGAPLVPVGDALLFNSYEYCLNLGGFANASTAKNGNRIAYDICPVNIGLNPLAERLGLPYDDEGKMAVSGKLLQPLLDQLNTLPFYQKAPPKSLGLEWVIKNVFPLLDAKKYRTEDLLHTFTEHCAMQLAANFKDDSSVLITGGGAYNLYLLQRLKYHKNLNLIIPEKEIIEYKEALIFGLLGVLKLRGETNCLSSVTGARKDHSSGVIYLPKNT